MNIKYRQAFGSVIISFGGEIFQTENPLDNPYGVNFHRNVPSSSMMPRLPICITYGGYGRTYYYNIIILYTSMVKV